MSRWMAGRSRVVSWSLVAVLGCGLGGGAARAAGGGAADPNAPAEITITNTVLRPREKCPPLGANGWGGCGAVEWAANNFVRDSGNEPIYWRDLHRVMKCGPNWFEIDGPGTSWYDLRASGFLSGADLRIYRLVDKSGKSLPLNKEGNYLDISTADHVMLVGKGRDRPRGARRSAGRRLGLHRLRRRVSQCLDSPWQPDRDGYPRAAKRQDLLVRGCGRDGRRPGVGSFQRGQCDTPQAGIDNPPHLLQLPEDKPLEMNQGQAFQFTPKVFGRQAAAEVGTRRRRPSLPEGLALDPG